VVPSFLAISRSENPSELGITISLTIRAEPPCGFALGVEEVDTELRWDRPWSPEKDVDDTKFILGFG
jgi:hypothetical protein